MHKLLTQYFCSYFYIIAGLLTLVHPPALSSLEDEKDPVTSTLLSELSVCGDETSFCLGLKLEIEEGWKIQAPSPDIPNPGSLTMKWQGSENIANIDVHWPEPKEFTTFGEKSLGYNGTILIPIEITRQDRTQPVKIKMQIQYLACSSLCIPLENEFELLIPVAAQSQDSSYAPQIRKSLHVSQEEYDDLSPFALLTLMLGFAFLGGLILNVMPCVLPVLSLKLMSLAKLSHDPKNTHYKSDFLATIAGIFTTMMTFALIAIILKLTGSAVGWGMHFQEPIFLIIMILLMGIFALSLLTSYEISLPGAVQNSLAETERTQKNPFLKEYLAGVFATLLATPCTAPFLGTALSYGLSRPAHEVLLIFAALAFGFATPYFLGLIIPRQYWILPKPGAWMKGLQKVLGIGLVGTMGWLFWVLCNQKGLITVSIVFVSTIVLLVLLWKKNELTKLLGTVAVLTALLTPTFIEEVHENMYEDHWQPFVQADIQKHVKAGKIVFVDVTADWCVNCKVNKALVLNREKVRVLLDSKHVIAMKADWTKADPAISKFLEQYNRPGIPFNIIFGPNNPNGLALPELLTIEKVIKSLEKAGLKV